MKVVKTYAFFKSTGQWKSFLVRQDPDATIGHVSLTKAQEEALVFGVPLTDSQAWSFLENEMSSLFCGNEELDIVFGYVPNNEVVLK